MTSRVDGDVEPQVQVSGNTLVVDGKAFDLIKKPADFQRSIEAGELKKILQPELARKAIIGGLIASYKTLARRREIDPDLTISVPPLFVIRLGLQRQLTKIITPAALKGYTKTGDKSIYTEIDEIKPKYHGYWRAISENNFIPYILTNYGFKSTGDIYLNLHVPKAELEEELGEELPNSPSYLP